MSDDAQLECNPKDFIPSLLEVVQASRLDGTKLAALCPDRRSVSPPTAIPRDVVLVSDGQNHAQWNAPPLRSLFRGNQVPPDLSHYPSNYTAYVHGEIH